MKKLILALSLLWSHLAAAIDVPAGDRAATWDVAMPPGKTREVPLDVTEGTWMNVDVSPDGRRIAFDLLGDIYTMPITGGEATRIADGIPYEVQPRFSPDGALIAFTSDRGGGDNIWIMNADGSNKRALTNEDFTLLNNPAWSPDGRYIAARKHLTTARSLGTGEIWLYHVGGGKGIALVERPDPRHEKELGEPIFSPAGDAIYMSRDTTPGFMFEYAQDSNRQVFAIDRYDMRTGERSIAVGGRGGAVRPTPSPDGRYLAYVHRDRGRTGLFVKDLQSGVSRQLHAELDRDLQETWAITGVYPNMGWLPDSSAIVFWAGGKIHRINADGSGAAEIPFRVKDARTIIDPSRPRVSVFADTFTTAMPRFAAVSPDGRRVVFESLGQLYVKEVSGGPPRLLTPGSDRDFQLFPTWSRDGRRIAFVSWNDVRLGELRIVAPDGSGMRTITSEPGHYRRPRFSPDGQTLVFERVRGDDLVCEAWSENPGVYRIPVTGGRPVRLSAAGRHPHFGSDSTRIFMTLSTGVNEKTRLISVDWNGNDQRVHAQGGLVTDFEIAPKGDFLAFRENHNVFLMPFFVGAKTVEVGSQASQMPRARVSREGGDYLHWSDERTLAWSLGPKLHRMEAADAIALGRDARETESKPDVSLAMSVRSDKPTGPLALVGARIVTMSDDNGGIIDDAAIVIEENRVKAVGRREAIALPPGTKVVDVSGKVIIPGLIDAHAHGPQGNDDLIPQQNWNAQAHLAFGVTTIHDPSAESSEIFPVAEMQRAGVILSPRTFSSGDVLFGGRLPSVYAVIDSFEDARAHVRRLKLQGAHSVKSYNQPRRNQRQQIIAAAREEGIAAVAEGGALFNMDVTLIIDGITTLEHNFPQATIYQDVLSLFGQTNVGYTPALTVAYGGLKGEAYWLQESQVWKHPLLTRYVPSDVLRARAVRVTSAPSEDFVDASSARVAGMLADRGVAVSIGGHGQQQGLAAHWEMWSFVRGGMIPTQALRAATRTPAMALGFQDIGSLEPGKLADLIVLNADPTENIRNSGSIDKVMLNGRLYDARTLNEEVTGSRQRRPYCWEQ